MDLLNLTKSLKPAFFLHEHGNSPIRCNVALFPILQLWSVWENVVLLTGFDDYVFVKNLYTNHKTILYLYDINWNVTSLNYEHTLSALNNVDCLICRCKDHAVKIEEYCGRKPLIINEINLEEIVNGYSKNC